MGSKFFITGVQYIYDNTCFREAIKYFPEDLEKSIKMLVLDTDVYALEKEEVFAFVDSQSISGVKVSHMKNGETTAYLGWNSSPIDIQLCNGYLRAIKTLFPQSTITVNRNIDGANILVAADISEDALLDEWTKRIGLMTELKNSGNGIIDIPALLTPNGSFMIGKKWIFPEFSCL